MNIKSLAVSLAVKITHPNHYNSEVYVNYLRKNGCHIVGAGSVVASD